MASSDVGRTPLFQRAADFDIAWLRHPVAASGSLCVDREKATVGIDHGAVLKVEVTALFPQRMFP